MPNPAGSGRAPPHHSLGRCLLGQEFLQGLPKPISTKGAMGKAQCQGSASRVTVRVQCHVWSCISPSKAKDAENLKCILHFAINPPESSHAQSCSALGTVSPSLFEVGFRSLPSSRHFPRRCFLFSCSLAFPGEQHFHSRAKYVTLCGSGCQALKRWHLSKSRRTNASDYTSSLLREDEMGSAASCCCFESKASLFTWLFT